MIWQLTMKITVSKLLVTNTLSYMYSYDVTVNVHIEMYTIRLQKHNQFQRRINKICSNI